MTEISVADMLKLPESTFKCEGYTPGPILGVIRIAYEVFCGQCGDWDRLDCDGKVTMPKIKADAVNRGWKYNKAEGWICPGCLKRAGK